MLLMALACPVAPLLTASHWLPPARFFRSQAEPPWPGCLPSRPALAWGVGGAQGESRAQRHSRGGQMPTADEREEECRSSELLSDPPHPLLRRASQGWLTAQTAFLRLPGLLAVRPRGGASGRLEGKKQEGAGISLFLSA